MKLLLIAALTILGTANAGVIAEPEPEHEYMYFPDGEGNPHLIDLKEVVDPAADFTRNVNTITFNLFTRNNPKNGQTLVLDSIATVLRSHYSSSRPTRFFIHGWLSSQESEAPIVIRDAYLEAGDYNVIIVDWSEIASASYISASGYVPNVGSHIASFINFLRQRANLDLGATIVVGHSLGGHIAGITAYRTSGTVQGVVSLDPALPGFYTAGPGAGVTPSDAAHVQVIHTNGGGLGLMRRAGHSDFYTNGGRRQPGCGLDPTGICSHARAYLFFVESILNPLGFRASNDNNVFMGGRTLTTATGRFDLTTHASSPFAMG